MDTLQLQKTVTQRPNDFVDGINAVYFNTTLTEKGYPTSSV